ncbi:GntR family transcriptional regulator [Bacillus mycoides]|uniref:GntR family transcriptional regulator n=1 Tax=Bacillus mycoides TaxID=1405 RepID=UPI0010BE7BA7|nr:GntR family transcriptional regulator [Bacillus mycoides]TKI51324.1 GntR family transcriptional regulator [Bacillus mycoides]
MRIDFKSNIPIYIQITEFIKNQITSGYLKPGDKLASVRELEDQLQVSSNTIQHAFRELEKEDIIIISRGRGRYVTNNLDKISRLCKTRERELVSSFINGMEDLGFVKEEIFSTTLSFVKGNL